MSISHDRQCECRICAVLVGSDPVPADPWARLEKHLMRFLVSGNWEYAYIATDVEAARAQAAQQHVQAMQRVRDVWRREELAERTRAEKAEADLVQMTQERDEAIGQHQECHINKRIIANGVAWHRCRGCGLRWPFPSPEGASGRDWRCSTCVSAEASKELRPLQEAHATLQNAAEMLWVVLASVSGGDWTQQTSEWQDAAARWRDAYFVALTPPPATTGEML